MLLVYLAKKLSICATLVEYRFLRCRTTEITLARDKVYSDLTNMHMMHLLRRQWSRQALSLETTQLTCQLVA
jgi:hypothetical protein